LTQNENIWIENSEIPPPFSEQPVRSVVDEVMKEKYKINVNFFR